MDAASRVSTSLSPLSQPRPLRRPRTGEVRAGFFGKMGQGRGRGRAFPEHTGEGEGEVHVTNCGATKHVKKLYLTGFKTW